MTNRPPDDATPFWPLQALMLLAAALATVSGAWPLGLLHWVAKPAVMGVALVWVLRRAGQDNPPDRRFTGWLVAALLCSLGGDVCLMLPGDRFIPGLASFLLAHLCYLALLRQGVAWFPSRAALWGVLTIAVAMYALLWGPLREPALRVAVAAYVGAIGLMVAQAIGRAQALKTPAARGVALGAAIFMLSDTLIAIDRFLQPLPLALVWILLTYGLAQWLIVRHAQPPQPPVT